MTGQIAADYDSRNIVCNAMAPGKILTGKGGRAVEQRWLDYSTARTPWPRLGTPIGVANAALFLASDEATFLTGHNLFVDGGLRLEGLVSDGVLIPRRIPSELSSVSSSAT